MKRILSVALVIVMLLGMIPAVSAAETTPTAITAETVWSYLDDNTDPAGDPASEGYVRTSWTAESYDDSEWKTNVAPFGAQNGNQSYNGQTPATKLEGCTGSDNTFAYFFRTDIQIDSLEGMTQLKGTIEYDDAMILYINGVKVADGNNIACDASGATLGKEIDANLQYGGENLNSPNTGNLALTDLSVLHEGVNTVAVEVHQQRATSSDVWFNMTLELSDEPLPDAQSDISISMGADETQMNFTWYAAGSEAGTLLIAKNADVTDGVMPETAAAFTANATEANDGQYSNQVTVTGLEAGVTYAYQLVNGNDASAIYTFTTDDGGDFSFAYVGDPQIGASGNVVSDTTGWAATLNQIATNELFSDISFMLSAGDQVNTASDENQYDGYLNHEALANLPVATVVGNHDSGSNAYGQHFNLANESTEYGVTNAGGDSYFVYNNVLFLILNSNDQSAAEHKAFMEAAIAANPNVSWKVVAFHHSLYTVASHAYDSDILSRRENWVPIFEELDIDVVLQGHDHVYTRSYIMDGFTPVTDAAVYDDANYSSITDPDGILYVTANSGSGSKTYNIMNETFDYSAAQNQEHIANVSKVFVSDNQFTITTYRATDLTVIDTFTINRTTQEDISLSMGADQSQMNVTWYADTETAGTVRVAEQADLVDGKMPENADEFTAVAAKANEDAFYSNQATMTGLKAGTAYAYQLVNGNCESEIYTFTTAEKGEFSFAYVGDPQIGAGGNVVNDTNGWANTLNQVATNDIFSDISFMLSAGDQVNTASDENQYDGYLNHEALANLPVATVVGNHDSGSNAYGQHFNLANESTEYGVTNAGGDSYFVYNNVLFLVLNSNDQSAAEHKAFMEAAIAANPNVSWKVVAFHHSLYTVASHAYDSDILSRRENWVPIFEELDIDVVLQGHDHVYTRSYIMDGFTPITDAAAYNDASYSSITNPDGILYVTANSGSGSKTYNIKNETFDYSAVQNQEHIANVSKVSVSDEAFTITTYRATDMSVVDTFTIYHDRVLEAEDAKDAAEAAQKAAEEAQAAAEAALKAAEEAAEQAAADKAAAETAKAEAEAAQKAAEETANQAASDKAAAETAKAEAEAAKKEAEDAADKAAADKAAAETAKAEAETAKAEAEAALKAAEEAQKAAEEAAKQAAADKAAMEEAAKAAQEALEKAEAAKNAAEEAQKAAEEAAKEAHCPSKKYSDVADDAWYHEAVDYVLNNGLMQGDGDDTFDPEMKLTRATLVQILYNMAGKPEVTVECKFTDVTEGQWFYDAVVWAAENGYVTGYNSHTFGADDLITREQLATIFWRYAGKPEANGEIAFADAADVDEYAVTAVAWAAENGVVSGVGGNKFDPNGASTRAQAAKLMQNFCELVK